MKVRNRCALWCVFGTCLLLACSNTGLYSSVKNPEPHTGESEADARPGQTSSGLKITFDYRFDGGFFSEHPERRVTLEAAGAIWSEVLASEFEPVPARYEPRLVILDDGKSYRGTLNKTSSGKSCQKWTSQSPHEHTYSTKKFPDSGLGDHNYCRNPDGEPYPWCYTDEAATRWETCDIGTRARPTIDAAGLPPIDGIVVFVYAQSLHNKAQAGAIASYPEGTLTKELTQRLVGIPFQPWAGRLTVSTTTDRPWFFDQTPHTFDDIPNATHYDFLSTALHEIGHILGYAGGVEAFKSQTVAGGFGGVHARALNDGQPIPLLADQSHIAAKFDGTLIRPDLENQLMGSFDWVQGYRTYPSRLDAAVLTDLGHTINESGLSRYHRKGAPSFSPYQDLQPDSRALPQKWVVGPSPAAYWTFDDSRYLNSAVVGAPVLYQPKETGLIGDTVISGGIRIPRGALLFAEHGIDAGNCGGKFLNCWTAVFDVRVPLNSARCALINTNAANGNEADGWIINGRVGSDSLSPVVIEAETWHRVVVVSDQGAGTLRFFVDGALVHGEVGGTLDGRYSLNIGKDPLFTLFADSQHRDAPIDVKRVVFYDSALSKERVASLGVVD